METVKEGFFLGSSGDDVAGGRNGFFLRFLGVVEAWLPGTFKYHHRGHLWAFKAHFAASIGVSFVPGDKKVGAEPAIDTVGRGHGIHRASVALGHGAWLRIVMGG